MNELLESLSLENDRKKTINIQVSKFYTNVDGTLLDKNLVNDSLKVKMPIYLFNKFDKDGGYRISGVEAPPSPSMFLIKAYVKTIGYDFTEFSGLNNVSQTLSAGDLVFIYADNPSNPNVFIWVVQSLSTKSLGSLVENDSELFMKSVRIFPNNITDYIEALSYVVSDKFGDYNINQISQQAFRYPKLINNSYAEIPFSIELNKHVGFTTYLPFASDGISYDFEFLNK
jgi:hypothetical protein